MTQEKTSGNAPETGGNAPDLRVIADQIDALRDLVLERCEDLEKKIDHADGLAHEVARRVAEIHADLEKYRPLLERYADPGKAVRDMFSRAKAKGAPRG